MQFKTLALSLLSIGSALAQNTKVQVVNVSAKNGSLGFYPNNIKAAVGDMVQFQFWPMNHSVVQSTFDAPCTPINEVMSNVTGIFSGFQAVKADDTMAPVYTIEIKNTMQMWLYCSQGKHCQSGMVMAVNENQLHPYTRELRFQLRQGNPKQVALRLASGGAASTNSTSGGSSSTTSGGTSKSTSASAASLSSVSSLFLGSVVTFGMALFI